MRVLHLTTYPVAIPRHGGQARVANILATYAAAGIESRFVAVYQPEIYGPDGVYGADSVGPHDIPFPRDSVHRRRDLPLCTDLASGQFAAADPVAWAHFEEQLVRFRPDVVQLEHPWLWPVVARARREGRVAPFRVVYSSQNVEAPLKRHVLEGTDPVVVERVTDEIETLERVVVRNADLVVAVTPRDAATYRAWGAERVLVARNGIAERVVDPPVVAEWRRKLRGVDFALFVGSAYPPNLVGFWDMFAPSLAFLAPHQRIAVVGGITQILTLDARFAAWREVNASRLLLLGEQDERVLGALLRLASCIVLPITVGGGSNIKTAEAIFARTLVVGTTVSLRGYEDVVAELSGIYCADEPATFRRLVKAALDGGLPRPEAAPEVRRRVLWQETLAALPEAVAALARGVPEVAAAELRP